jgi:hypothetical protein
MEFLKDYSIGYHDSAIVVEFYNEIVYSECSITISNDLLESGMYHYFPTYDNCDLLAMSGTLDDGYTHSTRDYITISDKGPELSNTIDDLTFMEKLWNLIKKISRLPIILFKVFTGNWEILFKNKKKTKEKVEYTPINYYVNGELQNESKSNGE